MSVKSIRNALGLLQDDSDDPRAWAELRSVFGGGRGSIAPPAPGAVGTDVAEGEGAAVRALNGDTQEVARLLVAARQAHEGRREYDAVAQLLAMESKLYAGTPRELDVMAELARVLDDELLDDERALKAYKRILTLRPGDAEAEDAIEKSEAKRARWRDLVQRYVDEAKKAGEASFKSSLLVSAAEVAFRYGRPDVQVDDIVGRLHEAIAIDPKNRRAELLLERVYREEERWEELAAALTAYAKSAAAKDEKVSGFLRLARVFLKKLKAPERAVTPYERILELAPGHDEATAFLVDHFTEAKAWEKLVALYDGQLQTGAVGRGEEVGVLLQVAMVHWKKREDASAAEPYFERLRKLEPAHPLMLGFFRLHLAEQGDAGRMAQILHDAQRALPDGKERSALVLEAAKLAEEGANAQKAIEQWRTLLRQSPDSHEARDALKRLYRQTAAFAPLLDLLRQELERTGPEDAEARLPLLRDMAVLYRDHLKNDAALVAVLAQLTTLDPRDADALRELARAYEALGRHRDLLAVQGRLAELETEPEAKAELFRGIARRWLDQFNNLQNAAEAYERLRTVSPRDGEALERLRDLYGKRRAYKALFELLEQEVAAEEGGANVPRRLELLLEMARLAAERLERAPEAIALYLRVLEDDEAQAVAAGALDALEKLGEREKDHVTLARALELRVRHADTDAARLILLQKLGAVYAERLNDPERSMDAWRRALALSPGNAKALRVLRDGLLGAGDYDGLTALYETSGDWEGLGEVLSAAADRAPAGERGDEAKVELSYRAADVYTKKLRAPERAFRAYERILSVRPGERRAAEGLVPLYEKDEKWARLPALYEVLLAGAASTEEKLSILRKLVDVTGTKLQDRAAAFQHARLAYELAGTGPDEGDAREALAAFERAARNAGAWEEFTAALTERLETPGLPRGVSRAIRGRLAEAFSSELDRLGDAVSLHRRLVEEDEADEGAVHTLDRLLRGAERPEDLRWLFELRIGRATSDDARVDLLTEWAPIEEEVFAAPENAVGLYRRVLELSPRHPRALRNLARLLRASGDADGAVAVLERERDVVSGHDRAAREVEMARLLLDSLQRPEEALAACQRALEASPQDGAATEVAERLLEVPATRASAARLLDEVYDATGKAQRQAEVLEVRIATAASREDQLALYARLADVHEHKLHAPEAAFGVVARAAKTFPAELELWDRLAVLGNRTRRSPKLVEILAEALPPHGETALPEHVEVDLAERAATLYEEKLGDIDHARPYLERILARHPDNERAFGRLKQILTTREAWDDLEAVYERCIEAAADGTRRADLLGEIALVAEEIRADRPKAIGYYERILELEPGSDQAARALDSLYSAEGLWDRLAVLLAKRLEDASGPEATTLRMRLGALHVRKLGNPALALPHLDAVLEADPTTREAGELVEEMLAVGDLRARAAEILEAVYLARDDAAQLVRILEVRLETAPTDDEKRELLRRIATLRDERLQDVPGAFEAFARLVPLDPEGAQPRERLLDIGRRTGEGPRAAEVLEAAAAAAPNLPVKAEILGELARLVEETLGDASRAEGVYRRVLELAPADGTTALPAARNLSRLYAAAGEHAKLRETLRIEVGLEDDGSRKKDLLGRLGELCESALEDRPGAIEAWKARLEDDPADGVALLALDRLYTRTEAWQPLVEVLRARERLEEGAEKKALLQRVAEVLAEHDDDVDEAIAAYRQVVDEYGAALEPFAALERLYAKMERWPDVAESLEGSLGLDVTPAARLELLARLTVVRRDRLDDVDGAMAAARSALAIDTTHGPSRTALEGLLDHEDARREAAGILAPLYESEGAHEKHLRVLDIEAEYEEVLPVRLALFHRAETLAQQNLADPRRAFDYAARGARESAGEVEFGEWFRRLSALAATTGRYRDLSALLQEVAPTVADGDLQLEATLKVAEVARDFLSDGDLAREWFIKALEQRPDERRALLALDALYEERREWAPLLDVLKRRVDLAQDDGERKLLLFRQARLCDEALGDAPAAISVYEDILNLGLDGTALVSLERLYTRTERWQDLVAVYAREIEASGTSAERKATLHHKLATVHEGPLGDMGRAFEELEGALALDGQHAATVSSLEGHMAVEAHAARAASLLEPVYEARADWARVVDTLEVRLKHAEEDDERRRLLKRLAEVHEAKRSDSAAALETYARLLAVDVTDETTWAELERLAKAGNGVARLVEVFAAELAKVDTDEVATARLAKRTGELFEEQGDRERALTFYRRSYAFSPEEGETSFTAIDRLLAAAGRPAERVDLYRGALEHRTEADARVTTLHTIARLQEDELKEDDAAVETHRQVLEVEETDHTSLEALSRILARRGRHRDLADHVRKRAELAAIPEEEARFRFELGKLHEERLEEIDGAIDEYQQVVDLVSPTADPAGRGAVAALEALLARPEHKARIVDILRPLYERIGDWRKLITLNRERFELAETVSDKVVVLRETSLFWEERGKDHDQAFDAMGDAFVLDPEDGESRTQIDRLGEVTKRWDDLAATYERAIAVLEGDARKELLGALGRLHDRLRDDPRRALDAYDRLFKLDETDIAPLVEMEALATLLSDWPVLVRTLAKKAELVEGDGERASTWRHIGESRRDMLDDAAGAVDAYERALELEPDSTFTLDCLIDLYEGRNDAARLVHLYRRRVELSGEDDQDLKLRLLVEGANRYEQGLGDRREAIALLSEALAVRPGDPVILRRLGDLYATEQMWPELLDNLKDRVAATATVEGGQAERRGLEKRIAALLADELDDPEGALEVYGDLLAGGFDAEAAAALRKLGETRDELRERAAARLEPVLRSAGQHGELIGVLEMRLRAQQGEGAGPDRAQTLRAIATLAEENLGDREQALGALLRALPEDPEGEGLHDEIVRIAKDLGGRSGFERYADVLADRATAIFDPTVTAQLFRRLGKVAEEHLEDDARAARALVSAVEQGGDDEGVLGSLDRLYGRMGDHRALADVLERRLALEAKAEPQADLYHRLAEIQILHFRDGAHGLASLKAALERVPSHEGSRRAAEALLGDGPLFDDVASVLEGVYRELSANEDLAKLYERRVGRAERTEDRIAARLELARVLEDNVGDGGRAQRAVEAAVAEDPTHGAAMDELSRLAEKTGGWAEAEKALSRILADGGSELGPSTQLELLGRLAEWRRDRLQEPARAEEALAAALKVGGESGELLRALEDLQKGSGRERDRVETLRRRARVETDAGGRREILQEAQALAVGPVADPALGEVVLRQLLEGDESDGWALEELTKLREAAGDYAEVVTLLLRRAELEGGGEAARALLHTAAEAVRDRLGDKARAITLYKDILEQEPADAGAAQALRVLYTEQGRSRDLGALLVHLVDVATAESERSSLRLALADLQATTFEAPRDAAETLRAILGEVPDHRGALDALSQLLERTGQDEELAELLSSEVEQARGRGDAAAELALEVRLAEIYEGRLKDTPRALETYEAILSRDGAHRGALEAVARLSEGRGTWERAARALEGLLDQSSGTEGVALALRLAAARESLADADGMEAALRRALALDAKNGEVRTRLRAHYERTKKWPELADLLVGDADLVDLPPAPPPPDMAALRDSLLPPAPAVPAGVSMAPPPPGGSMAPPSPGASLPPGGRGGASMGPPPGGSVPPVGPVGDYVKLLRRAAEIHLKERSAPQDAVPLLERASVMVPLDRELLLVLCDAYTAAHREQEAVSVLERIIASFGNRRTKELAVYHHRLAKALSTLGDRPRALGHFDMAFRIDPGSVQVLRDLGVLAYEADDMDRAQKTFRALLLQRLDGQAGITKAEVFYYLGEISAKQGDKAKALQMLERAVENDPSLEKAKARLAELKG